MMVYQFASSDKTPLSRGMLWLFNNVVNIFYEERNYDEENVIITAHVAKRAKVMFS